MKTAIIYDRINKFGGAERVILALHKIYPEAPIFTLVHDMRSSSWARGIRIIPTFLNKLPFLRKRHEILAPLAPLAFETHNLANYEVIISVTSSDAKSVITKPNQLHVCLCLTPTRYFWSGWAQYYKDWKMRWLPQPVREYFAFVDLMTSQRPDVYLSISREVQKRVKKYYKRESTIVYPPIENKFYSKIPIAHNKRHYYLVVSRLVPYKRVDLAISAFNQLGYPLIIVGDGQERNRLTKDASSNITFVGQVNDHQLIKFYRHAKAVVFPQEEDFGLVPIEAQASKTPVIAYARGGALETVVNGQTGLLFQHQTVESLIETIKCFEGMHFNYEDIAQNAERFRERYFKKKLKMLISLLWNNHQGKS